MAEQRTDHGQSPGTEKPMMPNLAGPIWQGQTTTCAQCRYSDQDIDTCPCARCHTRN